MFYIGPETIRNGGQRHYWRAVIDDPAIEHVIPLRVRFKDNVWVTTGWEVRMHVIQVPVQRGSTVKQVIEQIRVENQSPYLLKGKIGLSVDGKQLAEDATIEDCGLSEYSLIDGVETETDHLDHLPEHRPKDWNVDEITQDDASKSPYHEMDARGGNNLAPRYEGKPRYGHKGRRNYGPVRES